MLEKTVCELFAGVGGFRLGLEHSSPEWKTVWANQWEPGKTKQWAYNCYCEHFGYLKTHVNEDISQINKTEIPNHNLLVGGFPCQDYSVARSLNGSKGINGKKGVLWWEIRDILEKKNPKFVLLENVDRLLKSPSTQRGRDFAIMLYCFNSLGYSVEWRVLNAADYGFVQRRRRVFIFASMNDTTYNKALNINDIDKHFETAGFFARTFPVEEISKISNTNISEFKVEDISDSFKYPFENSGLVVNGKIYTTQSIPKITKEKMLREILVLNPDEKYYVTKNIDKWKYLKGSKKIERTSKTGHTYTFSEGAIAFPDYLDRPARTMLTSESSVNRSSHLIQDPVTDNYRTLTPIEAERIQGFDDNWTNTGMPEKFRYFCMGNALVVGLITKMGHTINKIFEEE